MTVILNKLTENPLSTVLAILLIVTIVILLIVLWKNGKKEMVKAIIYALVCAAEKEYGSKTGLIKLADVWAGIYVRLPWLIRLVFTKAQLDEYIEWGVEKLKKWAADNPSANLLGYAEEKSCNIM